MFKSLTPDKGGVSKVPKVLLKPKMIEQAKNLPRIRIGSVQDLLKHKELDRGGEAAIYRLSDKLVAKMYHLPNAPEYKESLVLQQAALTRLVEVQRKLLKFPANTPPGLIGPSHLVVTSKGNIAGYLMPFVEGVSLDRMTRTTGALSGNSAKTFLIAMYDAISRIHASGIVIGDLSENNILISKHASRPIFIDADSMQFGGFLCKSFTPKFTDPDLLKVERNDLGIIDYALVKQHSQLSDWYSFLVIAMRLIVKTDPYGGVLKGVSPGERVERRITVFDPSVTYPRVALPLDSIPRELLSVFVAFFVEHKRFVPSRSVFENIIL